MESLSPSNAPGGLTLECFTGPEIIALSLVDAEGPAWLHHYLMPEFHTKWAKVRSFGLAGGRGWVAK